MSYSAKHIVAVCLCMALAFVLVGCESPKPQAVKTVKPKNRSAFD